MNRAYERCWRLPYGPENGSCYGPFDYIKSNGQTLFEIKWSTQPIESVQPMRARRPLPPGARRPRIVVGPRKDPNRRPDMGLPPLVTSPTAQPSATAATAAAHAAAPAA